ncbi:MAG: DNA repair protein RecN [Lactococcus raffinolactis]|uniref:DNA repair protein RecN n=1 Tax=Pseudolactococcus raffinolactis TaxID=1366 RepID=A0A290Q5J3_9LACT|nr:DNA repair protein RecN [Lactococcus raffinolactis]MBR2541864.1 DNA repair protein RecN [Lactococcus sp.]ATC60588.1 DNA repair protein RecN [Lactococcus raffinolactis]MBW9331251.1 DNA repair protein RecN [Lactococcus raffinolactis]MCH4162748.1 DNA repair protein RecN [Lactococcus raffinolactis]MDN5414751.1 DNA repair protein RecN [Lactococcus raffinolactis]
MLQEISIKNFAIIDTIAMQFDQGMSILTGETGAGKSIIIDAMNLLLGSRAQTSFVRHGADKAEIEGLFFYQDSPEIATQLEALGFENTGELILRREIFANGRSSCRINGVLTPLSNLQAISSYLVDIHGQHDHQELMSPAHHLAMLDEFGDKKFRKIKQDYAQKFSDYKTLRQKLVTLKKNQAEFAQRIDILKFQIDEIASAEIDLKSDEGIYQRRDLLTHANHIAEHLNAAYYSLDDDASDYSSLSMVRNAMNELESASQFDAPSYAKLSEKIAEAYYLLEDAAADLEKRIDDLEFNPSELAMIEDRISVLTTLKKKYGPELTDVLAYLTNCQKELEALTGDENSSENLEASFKAAEKSLLISAQALSEARAIIADKLAKDVKGELADLYMAKADFKVHFEPAKFSINGNQHVEFFIQTNPGEGFKPLAKTASGGEMSRIMLAIKSSFARRENKTAIVFDEVDTGVSGRVAQAIANKIYKISQSGQVLCISHLPQVVAIADTQYHIEKIQLDDSTTSTVRKLTLEEREIEIAKMLAGDDLTPEALAQAKKLLEK